MPIDVTRLVPLSAFTSDTSRRITDNGEKLIAQVHLDRGSVRRSVVRQIHLDNFKDSIVLNAEFKIADAGNSLILLKSNPIMYKLHSESVIIFPAEWIVLRVKQYHIYPL